MGWGRQSGLDGVEWVRVGFEREMLGRWLETQVCCLKSSGKREIREVTVEGWDRSDPPGSWPFRSHGVRMQKSCEVLLQAGPRALMMEGKRMIKSTSHIRC